MDNATVMTTSVSDDGGGGGGSYSDLTDKCVEKFLYPANILGIANDMARVGSQQN